MLILGAADVREALPMGEAVELMKQAFAASVRGDATIPPRSRLSDPAQSGVTLVMPARVDGASRGLAVKVVSVFDDNPGAELPRVQSAVIVLEPDTGRPLALVEGAALTAIRTAATSGAATDVLARPGSETLAILGAGVQARSHVEAMCAVRRIARVRIYSRTAATVDALIEELEGAPWRSGDISFSRADSPSDAVRGADVVCTTTTSPTPVLADRDVKVGAHVNAVGAFTPNTREIPGPTVARSWVAVDDRAAAREEAGDLIQARDEGLIDAGHVRAELGQLVVDPELRPRDPDHPTLFKSVGVAVQDVVAAAKVVEAAKRRGLGTDVDL